jgi:hypothetical protein
MYLKTVVVISLVLLISPSILAQDLEERFATFLFEQADVSKRFSVLIEKISISETKDSDGKDEVGAGRILQRFVMGNRGAWQRIDGINFNLMGPTDLSSKSRESQLVHENGGWYYSFYPRSPTDKITRFGVKAGIVDLRPTDTRRIHPFNIATTQYGGVISEQNTSIVQFSPKLVNEEVLRDGRTRMTMFLPIGDVFVVTFNKDHSWCIEEIEFQVKINEVSQQNPPPLLSLTKDMLKEYRTYATNRTQWEDVGSDQRVPKRTIISSIGVARQVRKVEMEIRFLDWKFGDDVDEELLDDDNFTPEKLQKAMDFDKLRQRFDELR